MIQPLNISKEKPFGFSNTSTDKGGDVLSMDAAMPVRKKSKAVINIGLRRLNEIGSAPPHNPKAFDRPNKDRH